MAQFLLKRGNLANLNSLAIKDGQFIVVKDERAIYVDVGTERIRMGDFQEFATLAALQANTNPSTTALYYVKDINCLAKWDGAKYTQINTDTGATSVEVVGTGNAVTAASYDAVSRKLTLTKGETFATKGEHDALAGKVNALEVTGGQANVIETVKVNGVALEVTDKAVDVIVPTGALAGKDKVAEGDLETALATKINGKLDASEVTGDLLTHNASEFATAAQGAKADTAVQPAAIADMATNAGQKVITDALAGRIKVTEETLATHGDIVTHNVSEFATAAQGAKADSALQAADKEELQGNINGVAGRVKAIEDDYLKGADKTGLQGEIASALAEAKKYADDNDADTTYGIVYDTEGKKIKLVAGETNMEIDATAFIKDGMVSGVEIKEIENVKNLVITFNTDAGKEAINVPLTQLIDIYTGVDGDEIKVVVSSDNKISAELKNGSIAKERLSAGVQESLGKADTALQSHQDISHLATKTDLSHKADAQHGHEMGEINGLNTAINGLDGRVETLEGVAEEFGNYKTAHQGDYTNTQIDNKVTEAVNGLNIGNYLLKTDAPGYGDILTKTDAATLYAVVDHNHNADYAAKSLEKTVSDHIAAYGVKVGELEEADTAIKGRLDVLEKIDHEAYKGYADQAEQDAKDYSDDKLVEALTWGEF